MRKMIESYMKCRTAEGGWVVFSGIREVERKKLPVPPFSCIALPTQGPHGMFHIETDKQKSPGKKSCSVTLLLCPPQYIKENRIKEWIWQQIGQGWIQGLFMLCAKSLQSCPILCDPMDCSPPGTSVQGILQARTLKWFAIPFSRGSSRPRDWTQVSCIAGRFFTIWTTKEVDKYLPQTPLF